MKISGKKVSTGMTVAALTMTAVVLSPCNVSAHVTVLGERNVSAHVTVLGERNVSAHATVLGERNVSTYAETAEADHLIMQPVLEAEKSVSLQPVTEKENRTSTTTVLTEQNTGVSQVKAFRITSAKTDKDVRKWADQEKKKATETKKDKTSDGWDKKLIADVDHYLNIREKPTTESRIVGKLYRGAGAVIKKKGREWTKITSGQVSGYVKNEYCAFGEKAKNLAEKICDTHAVVKADGLRIREKANKDAKILTLLDKGQSVKVTKNKKAKDGWVEVRYAGQTAYLSEDYVKVAPKIKKAVSIQEEKEAALRNAAGQSSTQKNQESETTDRRNRNDSQDLEETLETGAPASGDSLTLLAAIIECEAGGEPYEGQLAVGAVVLNRVHSSEFPDTISEVIYQKGQFTPVRSGKLSRVLSSGDIGKNCFKAAREALAGSDNTGGAKYFHAGTSGNGQVIGTQIFY